MKTNTKETVILMSILIIVIVISMGLTNRQNKIVLSAKNELLQEEINKNRISEKEKMILEINKQNEKAIEEQKIINEEIKKLDKSLGEKEFIEECLKIQINRVFEGKDIIEGFCEKQLDEKLKNNELSIADSVQKVKKVQCIQKTFEAVKSDLFMCLEVKEKFGLNADEFRCASFMTMVGILETQNGKTGIGPKYKNWFGIKNPTDKIGLNGSIAGIDGQHIEFETPEMSKFAFAYYYMKYHDTRTNQKFVEKWVGWNNVNYRCALDTGYDKLYLDYKNLF